MGTRPRIDSGGETEVPLSNGSGLRTLWAREEVLPFPFFSSAFTTSSLGNVEEGFHAFFQILGSFRPFNVFRLLHMDYVTRQFINLAKKLRDDLRKGLTALHKDLVDGFKSINQKQERYEQRRQAEKDQKPSIPPILQAELTIPEDEKEQQRTDTNRGHSLQLLSIFVTFLAFLAAAIYACETHQQLNTMNDTYTEIQKQTIAAQAQVGISQEALHAVQRAFVIFHPTPDINWVAIGPTPLFWRIRIPMQNDGTTPAHELIDRVSWLDRENRLPNTYDFHDLPEPNGTNEATSGKTVAPKETIYTPTLSIPESVLDRFIEANKMPGQVQVNGAFATESSKRQLYVYGWAVYRDVFERTPKHLTEFCFYLAFLQLPSASNQRGGTEWAYCPRHNCMDKECPDYEAKTTAP